MMGGTLRGRSSVVLVCPSLVPCPLLTSACDCHSPALAGTRLDSPCVRIVIRPSACCPPRVQYRCTLLFASRICTTILHIVHCFRSGSLCFISSFLVDTCLLSRSTLDPLVALHRPRPSLMYTLPSVHTICDFSSSTCRLSATYDLHHHHSRLPAVIAV